MFILQVTIVSLPHSPELQLTILAVIELIYFGLNIYSYMSTKNFKYFILFLGRIAESLSLFVIYFFFYRLLVLVEGEDFLEVEKNAILSFWIGIFLEFGFVLISVGCEVYEYFKEKKSKFKEE